MNTYTENVNEFAQYFHLTPAKHGLFNLPEKIDGWRFDKDMPEPMDEQSFIMTPEIGAKILARATTYNLEARMLGKYVQLLERSRDFSAIQKTTIFRDAETVIPGLLWKAVNPIQLVAAPGVGKSYLACALQVALACQKTFLGLPVVQHQDSLYLDFEWGDTQLERTITSVLPSDKSIDSKVYYHDAANLRIPAVPTDALVDSWCNAIFRTTAELVIIDSQRQLFEGSDENDSATPSVVYAFLKRVSSECAKFGRGVYFLILAHTSKNSNDKTARGSGNWEAQSDARFVLTKETKASGEPLFNLSVARTRRFQTGINVTYRSEVLAYRITVYADGSQANEVSERQLEVIEDASAKPADLKEIKIREILQSKPGLNASQVLKMVGGNEQTVRAIYKKIKAEVDA